MVEDGGNYRFVEGDIGGKEARFCVLKVPHLLSIVKNSMFV